jgi:hypothetical protein
VGEVVIGGISSCDDATMAAGYGQAFVAVAAAKIVYSVDLSHLGHDHGDGGDHGLVAVPTEVSFSPGYMTVSGVPRGTACVSEEQEVEEGSGTGGTSSAAASTLPSATTALLFGCALASAWLG